MALGDSIAGFLAAQALRDRERQRMDAINAQGLGFAQQLNQAVVNRFDQIAQQKAAREAAQAELLNRLERDRIAARSRERVAEIRTAPGAGTPLDAAKTLRAEAAAQKARLEAALKAAPGIAAKVDAGAEDLLGQRMDEAEGPLRPTAETEARKQAVASTPELEGLSEGEVGTVLDEAKAVEVKRRKAEADAKVAEIKARQSGDLPRAPPEKLTPLEAPEMNMKRLAGVSDYAKRHHDEIDWEELASLEKLMIDSGLPPSVAYSSGVNVSGGAIGFSGAAGLNDQIGEYDMGEDRKIALQQKLRELSPKTREFISRVRQWNREFAEAKPGVLTDPDWDFWRLNLINPFADGEVFSESYNRIAKDSAKAYTNQIGNVAFSLKVPNRYVSDLERYDTDDVGGILLNIDSAGKLEQFDPKIQPRRVFAGQRKSARDAEQLMGTITRGAKRAMSSPAQPLLDKVGGNTQTDQDFATLRASVDALENQAKQAERAGDPQKARRIRERKADLMVESARKMGVSPKVFLR